MRTFITLSVEHVVTGIQRRNRFSRSHIGGFVHFPFEFWHFNKDDALGQVETGRPGPAKYGPVHWDPETNAVTPYEDPMSPLNPLDVIEREIAAATERASV